MSKPVDTNAAPGGSKEMKGLVAAAAMMAEGSGGADKKRSEPTDNDEPAAAKMPMPAAPISATSSASASSVKSKAKDISASRTRRLEQNRRAAIESRRRKKVMIGELQRSVTFYAKANDNLKMDNLELEQRLFLAKQRVMQTQMGSVPAAAAVKSPQEESIKPVETNQASEMSEPSRNNDAQLPRRHVAVAATITFPPLHQTLSPIHADQAHAKLTATNALYETMGYPSGAARANTLNQLVGLTGIIPSTANNNAAGPSINLADPSLEVKPSASEAPVTRLPSEAEVGSDQYVETLKKFAIQQTAAANAAAAAANAAIQVLNWHHMMKNANGNPQPTIMPKVPTSVSLLLSPMTTTNPKQPSSDEEEQPRSKKQKL